jgi:hypothetical protein
MCCWGTLVPALDQVAARTELISAAQTVTEVTARHWYVLTDRAELLTGLAPELLFDSLPRPRPSSLLALPSRAVGEFHAVARLTPNAR